MDEIKSIDQYVFEDMLGKEVRKVSASLWKPFLLILVGIVLIVINLTGVALFNSKPVTFSLIILGMTLIVWGFCSFSGGYYVAAKSGLRIKMNEFGFSHGARKSLKDIYLNNEYGKLAHIAPDDSLGSVVKIFSTDNGDFVISQLQEYVPHQYVPVVPVRIHEGEEAKTIKSLIEQYKKK